MERLPLAEVEAGFTNDELDALERSCPEGLSSDSIIGLLGGKGIKLTEASLRKYVQLGLLPRSRRVRLQGGSRGSQGLYPASVVRRIQRLRTMMGEYTIEEIKQGFLFVRGDVEELEQTLERIFARLGMRSTPTELAQARKLAGELVEAIGKIEEGLAPPPRSGRSLSTH